MIKLTVLAGPDTSSIFTLDKDAITIGRGSACDVVLGDASASRRHCSITRQGDSFILTDLESGNGTFVNDRTTRITTQHTLKDGEEILLGKSRLRVEFRAPAEEEELTKIQTPEERRASAAAGPTQGDVPSPADPPTGQERLAAIRQPDVPIVITVISGPDRGMVYSPAKEVFSIGRANTCDIVLHDPRASRLHATIRREAGKYRLHDENSANGTFLRTPDERVSQTDLVDGDTIYIGQTQLRAEIHLGAVISPHDSDATIISGTVAGKSFSFNLTALGSSSSRTAHRETPEDATQISQPRAPATAPQEGAGIASAPAKL
ncbi:MAG: FHA domain-containing protein, partial [Candidatus Binatia bacterium]